MSTDICNTFRTKFTYGDKDEVDLADQLMECCSSHLATNPHIDSIEDVFDDTNFTRVAMPIMQCQRDTVVAFDNRMKQIDAVCKTGTNWDHISNDASLKLPKFMKGDEGKTEFIDKCTSAMKARDKAKGTTGRKLEVTFDDVKGTIRTNMGPKGNGHWQKNMSNIGSFCKNEAHYDWGGENKCCITWVTEKIDLDHVTGVADFDKSLYNYLKAKNDGYGYFQSLKAEVNPQDQSLYHQCGVG